jgi:chromosome segregation ATPase
MYGGASTIAELKSEIDQLRSKLATQASENTTLQMRLKTFSSKERDTEQLKSTIESLTADKRRLGKEVSDLKMALQNAAVECEHTSCVEVSSGYEACVNVHEDLVAQIACLTATVEELLNPGGASLELLK